jgi:hypothetical protein
MKQAIALLALAAPATVFAQPGSTPLFASDAPIHVKVQGPIGSIARNMAKSTAPQPGTLIVTATGESIPVQLSARGLSRRTGGICNFPPLRVQFSQPPAATSEFAKQKKLKLVTHCNAQGSFQQNLLLEYSAYPILNILTPLSFQARLAMVDYAEPSGKVSVTRYGFFLEEFDDVARRNGLAESRVGYRIEVPQLEPQQAALDAMFEYMVGNLDWSMRAGPQGEVCCHNAKLLVGPRGQHVPVIYDFDYSGLVDASYAIPPKGIKVRNVRDRAYRGYCRHNAQALAAAALFRNKRAAIEGVYSQIPGLEERTRRKALAYLATFYADIATDDAVRTNLLKDCIGG